MFFFRFMSEWNVHDFIFAHLNVPGTGPIYGIITELVSNNRIQSISFQGTIMWTLFQNVIFFCILLSQLVTFLLSRNYVSQIEKSKSFANTKMVKSFAFERRTSTELFFIFICIVKVCISVSLLSLYEKIL